MKKSFLLLTIAMAGLVTACNQTNKMPAESTADTAVVKENRPNTDTIIHPMGGDWDNVNLVDLPDVKLPEVKLPDLKVRGNDSLTAYSVGEKVLFDTDKSEIRPAAEKSLKQISASIVQRYPEGKIRIYGFTDSTDTKSYNKELSEKRAEAVKQWLVKNGNITETRVSIHPMGESHPVASNDTAKGRQENRRMEIVAGK